MIHKPAILHFLLFFSVFLFSFRNIDRPRGIPIPGNSVTARPDVKLDTGGRTVNLDSAQVCIDRFAGLMKDHGFSDQAGQTIDIHLTTTSMITTGESFDGKNLRNWLNTTFQQYKSANKKLMIKIQLGVYDLDYLNTYQPNATLRAAGNNRIAIFLIPYDAASGQPVKALAALPAGGTGGGTGYDLGGVQP